MYESCTWRGDDMSLLDFLRRTNAQGDIARWLRLAHKKAVDAGTSNETLEEFARTYSIFGEQLVAADMLSWRNDRHCGQWLVLHIPFRQMSVFLDGQVEAKVPPEHRYLAMAMLCKHTAAERLWCKSEALWEAMRREGHSRRFVEDVVRQLAADSALVEGYLSGRLSKLVPTSGCDAHVVRSLPIQPRWEAAIRSGRKTVEGRVMRGATLEISVGDAIVFGTATTTVTKITHHNSFRELLLHHGLERVLPGVATIDRGVAVYHGFHGYRDAAAEHGVVAFDIMMAPRKGIAYDDLNVFQKTYAARVREAVDHAFAVANASTVAEVQQLVDGTTTKVEACFGPPGTGKTAATLVIIEETLDRGGRVLLTVYTAQLACRMRERFAKHPRHRQLRIDTCHAVFGLGEDFAFLPLLGEYQLIVVDEISQLDGEQCDRIMRLREMVDNVPALAFMGDRWQMAGFGEVRPWDTRLWQASVHRTTLVQPYRCQDSTKA